MDLQQQIFQPHWFRFDGYEIKEGCIRPKSGAKLRTYSLMDDVDDGELAEKTRRKHAARYQPLLDLLSALRIPPSARFQTLTLNDEQQAAIIRWSSSYGLLGLLPHSTHFAFLAPRYKLTARFTQAADPTNPSRVRPEKYGGGFFRQASAGEYFEGCYAVQHCFSRENGSWISTSDSLNHSFPRESAGQLLSAQMQKFFPAPHVLFEELVSGSRRWASFASSWKRFFANVSKAEAETYAYPFPSSSQFWRQYGEPVDDFLRAAQLLRNALIDHDKGGLQGLRTLRRLINPIGIDFEPGKDDRGIKTMRWRSPSLLASWALMILLDFNNERRPHLHECERDKLHLFVSSAYQARYCSDRCRFAVLKRGQRGRKKEARRLSAEGMSAPQIDAKLGADMEDVRGWINKVKPEQKQKRSVRQK